MRHPQAKSDRDWSHGNSLLKGWESSMPETKDKIKVENKKNWKNNTILIFRVPFGKERKKERKKQSKSNFRRECFSLCPMLLSYKARILASSQPLAVPLPHHSLGEECYTGKCRREFGNLLLWMACPTLALPKWCVGRLSAQFWVQDQRTYYN